MYKVMLVDDDYPVLELIHYAIDWESMGLSVIGMHENGARALEAAATEMPDILITDIGMPQMNGLELIAKLKDAKPGLRAAILSCHDEFEYARQAMKLQVQDYLLKDTLDPAAIRALLSQFIASLEEEREHQTKQLRMERLVDRNRSLMKEKFIRATLQQPMLDIEKWKSELESYGLPLRGGETIIPVIGLVDEFRAAKQRFQSEEVLRFALDNVLEETIQQFGLKAVHFQYSTQETVLLAAFQGGLKVNGYEKTRELLRAIQKAVRTLKLSMSFLIGDGCPAPEGIKSSLLGIQKDGVARFYRQGGEITRAEGRAPESYDMFKDFQKCSEKLRDLILGKKVGEIQSAVSGWLEEAERRRPDPAVVKDWVLRLLLDTRLKLQSVLDYRSAGRGDVLPNEALELDTITELKEWMISHCLSIIAADMYGGIASKRAEIAEACQYVTQRLDRKITLEEVAEQLFMNPSYFSRLFKKETGETFIEYVTRMKMHRAKELLEESATPVGKICETLGYDNQSYFIKLFKSFSGLTPVEYRSQLRK
ncbi:helix-turn-helix domain-containing protein [Paenibacillus sp. LHD-117]|uniref:response regulator transcription factor n=1 Tax=Paenibacillus sp. LHD-117 TaxID=3071412 RepID=UPI0027E19B70|nr:helix-turn-helix domain-containing protein [Paenibacillus sp. LHD-117]MDQ6422787.1 helix-turn-helix domain-containing protein [Paenibacillus sp. LHD-117]